MGTAAAELGGKAPHVIEAVTPGAAGLYLDLGQFYDRIALQKERRAIEDLQRRYQSLYREAYTLLAAPAAPEGMPTTKAAAVCSVRHPPASARP